MKKNKKTIIGALLLIVVMTFSMVTSVFADDGVTNKVTTVGTDSATITSNFVFAEGLTVPGGDNGTTFNYTITDTNGGPTATIDPVNFKDSDRTATIAVDGLYTLSKTSKINFGDFTHAGFYTYTVSRNTTVGVDNVEHCESIYYLNVWVENDSNGGLTITNMTATKDGEDDKKVGELIFTHTYKNTGTLTVKKFTVSQTGKADLADKTKAFNFGINFNASPTDSTRTNITGTIKDKNEKYLDKDGNVLENQNSPSLDFAVGAQSTTFKMKDGDVLSFTNVPVGMQFKVSEASNNDGYTPSIKVVSNGTEATYNNFNEGNKAEFDFVLVGESTNSATFTNTYKDIPLTGIIMNNLPFIMLIGIAVLALSVLVISKKRRTADR